MKFLLILILLFTKIYADFAVISDIHYDKYYSTGSPTKCELGKTGMGCCRSWDIAINNSLPAPQYGSFGCDSPKILIQTIFEWLDMQNLEFLVFLGDIVDHDLIIQNPFYNFEEIKEIYEMMKNFSFPVFNVLGNHDSYLIDNLWDGNIGKEWIEKVNFSSGGFYSFQKDNITFIFLNSLFYDNLNLEEKLFPKKDFYNQTGWLYSELEKSKNITVYLFTHFPSETEEATNFYNNMISSLPFNNIIYFAGHSHHDEIRLMNNSFFYVHPSIVPDEHFPEFRIYKTKNNSIYDYFQYGFNLTSLNFEFIYSVLESYDLKNLSFSSWVDFFERKNNNSTLQELYSYHYNWGKN